MTSNDLCTYIVQNQSREFGSNRQNPENTKSIKERGMEIYITHKQNNLDCFASPRGFLQHYTKSFDMQVTDYCIKLTN